MSDEFKIINKRDYIEVSFPPYDVAIYKQYIDEVISYCHSCQCYRILGNFRNLTQIVPVTEVFSLGAYLSEIGSTEYMKFAIWVKKEVAYPDRFLENITASRGITLKVFTGGKQDILDWLLGKTG